MPICHGERPSPVGSDRWSYQPLSPTGSGGVLVMIHPSDVEAGTLGTDTNRSVRFEVFAIPTSASVFLPTLAQIDTSLESYTRLSPCTQAQRRYCATSRRARTIRVCKHRFWAPATGLDS